MPARPSSADVATEAGSLLAGLGILTFQLFPIALPLLVLVIAPLALLALAGVLLVAPVVLSLWLARIVLRRRPRRRRASAESVQPSGRADLARGV